MNTVATMNEETKRMQFNDIVANIKPLMTVGKGKAQRTLTGSAVVPLSCCFVDWRYQGMRTHKHLNRLKNKWDERKLTPIILVPHPEEYRFAVVDGQGRCLVAPEKGMDRLNAIILMDAPEDLNERLKFEAEYFIGQDSEVENVKPLEKHLSRVIIGDEAATILDKLLNKYGIKFVSTKGNREESVLGSYTDTYSIAKVHGEKCLDFIFSIIENAGWNKEPNGYATFVMRALREIWIAHPKNRKKIHTFLSKELRKIDPALFSANSKTKYPKRDHRVSCVLYVEDMLCDKLGIEKKIYIENEKKVTICK
ncbi:hypothetical protein C823_007830 [Eubacterium plexicaudatum ASF492]|uniref:ParB/Sulfiredoxin domain-containing protein n=1 Tax=Eubacterium plexicaudatum ASF492 TaxID=1235802 RepID=N2A3Y8_9FIRM|nr:hypothetical protein C823_007830 [Eubacterium plexicaudatum ASF492]